MHIAQVLLVEAESVEEARNRVADELLGEGSSHPDWSDWSNVSYNANSFAGRWGGEFFGKENTADILQYSSNPSLAESVIQKQLEHRLAAMQRIRAELAESEMNILDFNYDENPDVESRGKEYFEERSSLFALRKLSELYLDYWNSDSGLFDLQEGDAQLTWFRRRVEKSPEHQYLVVVDFHY